MIQFRCQSCGVALSVPDDKAGQSGECPRCGGPMHVPQPSAPVSAPAGPSPPEPPPAATARRGRNPFAIAGLVCACVSGLLGIVLLVLVVLAAAGSGPDSAAAFSRLGVLFVLAGLAAILGLVFSILGLCRSRAAGAGRGMAIAGLTLSALLTVLCGGMVAAAIHRQRKMNRWAQELWQRAKDGSGTGPDDLRLE